MEETATDQPRAFISCLACYNEGRSGATGRWVSLERLAQEQEADADERLYGEPTYGGVAEWRPALDNISGEQVRAICPTCGGDEFDLLDAEILPRGITMLRLTAEALQMYETLEEDADLYERILVILNSGIANEWDEAARWDDDHFRGYYADLGTCLWEMLEDCDGEMLNKKVAGREVRDWIRDEDLVSWMEHDFIEHDFRSMVAVWWNG